jgi:hypothetical protein
MVDPLLSDQPKLLVSWRIVRLRPPMATGMAILYVEQRTTSNDAVFVALPPYDKIFVNDVLLCFAMDRQSVTT